jgi:hypothetical protein
MMHRRVLFSGKPVEFVHLLLLCYDKSYSSPFDQDIATAIRSIPHSLLCIPIA